MTIQQNLEGLAVAMAVPLAMAANWPSSLQLSRAKNKRGTNREPGSHGAAMKQTHLLPQLCKDNFFGQFLGYKGNYTEAKHEERLWALSAPGHGAICRGQEMPRMAWPQF